MVVSDSCALGLNAVMVASSQAPELDHVVVCRFGVAIPERLPPAHDPADHHVDVYNTGAVVEEGDDLVPSSMLYMQRPGSPPPDLPSLRHILSNQELDCYDDQLPRPALPLPLSVAAQGPDFQQLIVDLQYGPATPQFAAVVGVNATDLQVWFQKGPAGVFGDLAVRGKVAAWKIAAFRHRGPRTDFMLVVAVRKVGFPVCSFISPTG